MKATNDLAALRSVTGMLLSSYGSSGEVRSGTLPIEKWLEDLDRIEHAAEQIRTPPSFASEAYTLREHIALVRRTVLARARAAKT